jgi:hypothetical protein
MTVADLISALQQVDPTLPVRLPTQWGDLDVDSVETHAVRAVSEEGRPRRAAETYVCIYHRPMWG